MHSVVISIFSPHHSFAKISSNQRTKAKYYKKAFSKSSNSPIWQFFAVLWQKNLKSTHVSLKKIAVDTFDARWRLEDIETQK